MVRGVYCEEWILERSVFGVVMVVVVVALWWYGGLCAFVRGAPVVVRGLRQLVSAF